MSYQVDGIDSLRVVEVDHEHEVGAVDVVEGDLLSRVGVVDDQADAGRGCDRPSILVTKAAHAGSDRLLFNNQVVFPGGLRHGLLLLNWLWAASASPRVVVVRHFGVVMLMSWC